MSNACTFDHDHLEQTARRRAALRMGWYVHATVYVTVNLFLTLIATAGGHRWAVFPAVGWGIGLAAHWLVVFLLLGGGGLRERLLQQERQRLARRDPW